MSEILCALTDDRKKLSDAIARVKTSNGTPYYDSLLQILKSFSRCPERGICGRRALIARRTASVRQVRPFLLARQELGRQDNLIFIKVDTEFLKAPCSAIADCDPFFSSTDPALLSRFGSKANIEAVNFCGLGRFRTPRYQQKLSRIADAEMTELPGFGRPRISD